MNALGKRRFIAGASCPACDAQDTMFVMADTRDLVECAMCGYKERKPESDKTAKENQVESIDEEQVVKFVDVS